MHLGKMARGVLYYLSTGHYAQLDGVSHLPGVTQSCNTEAPGENCI